MRNRFLFNGHRLQDARRLRGKTIAELSLEAGLSKQVISQYEIGKAQPNLDKAFLFANLLQFPIDFFFEDNTEELTTGTTFFRSFASTSKRERVAQIIRTEYIATIFSILSKYVDFPELEVKSGIFEGVSPEAAANSLRESWGIQGPIHDMVRLLESKGIFVSALPIGNENIDAFSQPSYIQADQKHIVCVVLGSEKESAVRRQFCAAHELGHLVLHDWDIDVEELKTTEFRMQEDEANAFAGAFLLPKDEYTSDLRKFKIRLDTFVELKRKWHVSIGAQIMRAHALGIVDDENFVRLMKSYSARGWRKEEPFDDTFNLETPVLAQKAIDLLLSSNCFDASSLLKEFSECGLSLNTEFIEELLTLNKGTLAISENPPIIVPLEVKLRNDSTM